MKNNIKTCIWFDNQATEAAEFYSKNLPGVKIQSKSDMVTEIEIESKEIMLLNGGPLYKPNPSVSFFYLCNTLEEFNQIINEFSSEASMLIPKLTNNSGGKFCWLKDKFNVSWQFSFIENSTLTQKLIPVIFISGNQAGNAFDAIHYYTSIFNKTANELISSTDKFKYVDDLNNMEWHLTHLNDEGFLFLTSGNCYDFNFTEGVSFVVTCEIQEEIDYYWDQLTKNGEESRCGWLRDKFGLSWQILPQVLKVLMSDHEKSGKTIKAFMLMNKLEIEKLVEAANAS